MMELHFAKSLTENEEGMNHLRIKLLTEEGLPAAAASAPCAVLEIDLPKGVYKSPNLNGLREDASGRIHIDYLSKAQDVVIEIYTLKKVPVGEFTVKVTYAYRDESNSPRMDEKTIPLILANADEMDELALNEDVITLAQALIEARPLKDTSLKVIGFWVDQQKVLYNDDYILTPILFPEL